ncbi:MAG: GAF domain-containing protein [Anaerolinea sp.]|nr:GAF domain-containing protein [Anaerolinea sp.]MCC6974892.1 GAF domain-containing protein [Anaerolineae bacterium]CAG0956723.1 two-component system, NarL family, sensor histidine kinase EvgS [Anaerolineae bacterium]
MFDRDEYAILCVLPDNHDLEALSQTLRLPRAAGRQFRLITVAELAQISDHLTHDQPDAVMITAALFDQYQKQYRHHKLPIIVVISPEAEAQSQQWIDQGALCCVLDTELSHPLVVTAIQGVILSYHRENARAANELSHRLKFEKAISEISNRLVSASPHEMDAALNHALEIIGDLTQADNAYIFLLQPSGEYTDCTHEWRTEGIESLRTIGPSHRLIDYPWWTSQMKLLRPLHFPYVSEMPPEAEKEQRLFTSQGVQSMLVFPLSSTGKFIGHMGINSYRHTRTWRDEDITTLRIASEIISEALTRRRTLENLMLTEERFQLVIAHAPIIIFTFDAQGTFTFAGGKALQDLNIPPESFIGKNAFDLFRGISDDVMGVLDNIRRVLSGEMFSALIRTASDLYFDTWYIPMRDASGTVTGALGVALDITERQVAEAAEREQRSFAEALSNIATTLSTTLDTEEIMKRVLANVGRVVPNEAATIFIFEGAQAHLSYINPENPVLRNMQDYIFPIDIPTFRYMIESGEPCLIQDTESPNNPVIWTTTDENTWTRSYLGIPIKVGGKVIGAINLDSPIPNFFTPRDAERLKIFAKQAAAALQNAQIYESLRRNAEPLAAFVRATNALIQSLTTVRTVYEVADQIEQALHSEYLHTDCRVYLSGSPSPGGLVNHVFEHQEFVYAPDVNFDPRYVRTNPTVRAELAIPLMTASGIIGVLDMRSGNRDAFSENDQRVLLAFAERASAALENAMLYEKLRSYATELEQRVIERTAALEEERAQLNTILESMAEGVIYATISAQIKIKYANQAFQTLTGYTSEDFSQPDMYRSLNFDSDPTIVNRTMSVLDAARREGTAQADIPFRRKNGSVFEAHIAVSRIRLLPDSSYEIVALVRDVSLEKRLQEQKDRFIANASHELRTPLTNFKMRLYLLRRQSDKWDEHLRVLEQSTNRMQQLVEDLLDVSRFERGVVELDREPTALQSLIEDVVNVQKPHADLKSLALLVQLPETPIINYVDRSRITQVLTNLVVNAINYTPEGGTITVGLETATSPDLNQTVIFVQDTGVGIPATQIDHIFEPFYRSKYGNIRGTGLGLTISKEIITLHGGSIEVRSQENVGTHFTVTLPLVLPDRQNISE